MLNDSTLGVDYLLTNPEAIKAYENKKAVELSPAYRFKLTPAKTDSSFDYEMVNIRVDHLAQVEKGFNGPSIRLSEGKKKKMSKEITLNEEDKKSIVSSLGEIVKELFKKESKTEDKETFTKEEHEAAVKEAKDFYNDKLLVQPLLINEKAKKVIEEKAENSQMVLGIALGLSEEETKKHSIETLRGRVQERLDSKKNTKTNDDEKITWENVNTGNGGENKDEFDFYSLEAKRLENRRKAQAAS